MGGDGLLVHLVHAVDLDHVDHLFDDVDVGEFQEVLENLGHGPFVGLEGFARFGGGGVHGLAELVEVAGVFDVDDLEAVQEYRLFPPVHVVAGVVLGVVADNGVDPDLAVGFDLKVMLADLDRALFAEKGKALGGGQVTASVEDKGPATGEHLAAVGLDDKEALAV